MDGKTTEALDRVLEQEKPEGLGNFLEENAGRMKTGDRPFGEFMRKCFKEKGMRQQDIFLAADLPERYAYKLVSGEKHTRQRDYIIRICLAAHFTLSEVCTALKLYGMSPLYSRIPRDAAFIIAFNTSLYDPRDVDALLRENGLEPLKACGENE